MKRNLSKVLLGLSMALAFNAKAQLTIEDNQTAAQLVAHLVGPGIQVMNPTLTCPTNASGKFAGTTNLGIDSGIVLGTCIVETAGFISGVNSIATNSTSGNNGSSDADLAALSSPNSANNACVLEFDFIPTGDTVKFEYVFGSEEYPEYACSSFNDIFAFLISGPGIVSNTVLPTKRNMALVPGTDIPITINSVNNGPGIYGNLPNCTIMGPGAPFSQYFVDNLTPTTNPHIVFDGMTTVLTAIQNVIPCETYHLKLAVADVSDGGLNSAVFVKAGSLMTTTVQAENITGGGSNSTKTHTVKGCKPAILRYHRTGCDSLNANSLQLMIGGDAIPNSDYQQISPTVVIPAGTMYANVEVKGLLGPYTGPRYVTISVLHPDSVLLGVPNPPIIRTDTVWIFDSLYVEMLSPEVAVCPNTPITIQAATDSSLNFNWTPVEYNNGSLTINPLMQTTRDFTITVTQPGAPATCPPNKRTYHALVEQYPIISMPSDTTVCIVDSAVIPVMVMPDTIDYLFKWNPGTGLRSTVIGTNYVKLAPGVYNYQLIVTTPQARCSSTHDLRLRVVPPFQLTNIMPPSGTSVPYNSEVLMSAGGAIHYTWYPLGDFIDPTLQYVRTRALETKTYQVVGMDQYGCKDSAEILINVQYPKEPIMPNAFSPNGDGRNDKFYITNNQYQKVLRFDIFNRWGQMVFSTMDPQEGWDGTYKGVPAPAGVYNYIISLEMPDKQIKNYKGDVTIIR